MNRKNRIVAIQGALFVLLALVPQSFAAKFILADGAGSKDGSSWQNALAQGQIASAANGLSAGDTLYVGSGTYSPGSISITASGSASAKKVVLGVDHGQGLPLFRSTWSETTPDQGSIAIKFEGNASHWVLKDLTFERWINCVKWGTGSHTGFLLKNLHARYSRNPFLFQSVSDVKVIGCTARKYTKKGFRINVSCDRLHFLDCVADATEGENTWAQIRTEPIVVGFFIDYNAGNVADITFENCIARNNLDFDHPSSYKNGDGFSSEMDSKRVKFVNCQAYDNQDGGFDCKGYDFTFDNCISFRNYRGYRWWNGTATYTNCISGYNKNAGFWADGKATVNRSTLVGNGTGFSTDGGSITANNCIVHGSGIGSASCTGCVTDDPRFVSAREGWNGDPADAFNSQKYATTKGYWAQPLAPVHATAHEPRVVLPPGGGMLLVFDARGALLQRIPVSETAAVLNKESFAGGTYIIRFSGRMQRGCWVMAKPWRAALPVTIAGSQTVGASKKY